MEKLEKEIDEMNKGLGVPPVQNPPEKEEEEEEEEKKDPPEEKEEKEEKEESEEKEEKEDPEKKEEKEEKEDPEKKEEKEEKPEEVTLETQNKIIDDLRRQLNERSGNPPREEKKEEKPEDKKEEKPEDKGNKPEPFKLEDQDFLGDTDLDDLVRDKDAFNKLLNSVYSKGVTDSKRMSTEDVLRAIPDIVKNNVSLFTTLQKDTERFYSENEDLVPYKKVVATVFEDIASKNPGKPYSELMGQVAPAARKVLNLSEKAVKKDKGGNEDKGNPPRLHGNRGINRQTPTKPNTSGMQSEIESMNKALGR